MDFRLTEEQVMFQGDREKVCRDGDCAPDPPDGGEAAHSPRADQEDAGTQLLRHSVPGRVRRCGEHLPGVCDGDRGTLQGVLLHRRSHFRQLPVCRHDQRFRHGGAEEKVSARSHGRRRRGQLCVHGAVNGIRSGRHPDDLRPGRQRLGHQRRKDLHHQFHPARIHRRFLQGRGKGQQDHQHHRPQGCKGILHAQAG